MQQMAPIIASSPHLGHDLARYRIVHSPGGESIVQNRPFDGMMNVPAARPGFANIQATNPILQRVAWNGVDRQAIAVTGEDAEFEATYNGQQAGTLSLYCDDDDRYWINGVYVNADYQGRGIGLCMLNAAREAHGAVYAATGMTADQEMGEGDIRHLTAEGARLVNSALRNGILQPGWCFNPADHGAEGVGSDHDSDGDADLGHDVPDQQQAQQPAAPQGNRQQGNLPLPAQQAVAQGGHAQGPLDRYAIRAVVTVQPEVQGQQGRSWSVEAHHFASNQTMTFQMPAVARVADLTENYVATAISQQIHGYPIITQFQVLQQ